MAEDYDKLIAEFAGGTTHEPITTIVAVIRDFVLFRIAGHHYWSSLGQPWLYARTEYVLIRKHEHGYGRAGMRWQGRMTKRVFAEIMSHAE